MNYTELSVTTQDVMPNKGVLSFNSGLTDFIQVGEPPSVLIAQEN